MEERKKVLEVNGLRTSFFTDDGEIPAVDGIDFYIREGEVLGIVGESGCGKSVTSLSIMGLVPSPPGKITEGEILFQNKDLTKLQEKQMRDVRGNDIAMIFQEPMTSLNPLHSIEKQVGESLRLHKGLTGAAARERVLELLDLVGIKEAASRLGAYPHELQ